MPELDANRNCGDCGRRTRWVKTQRGNTVPLVLCPHDGAGDYQLYPMETPDGTAKVAVKLHGLDLVEARENSDAPFFVCLLDSCPGGAE